MSSMNNHVQGSPIGDTHYKTPQDVAARLDVSPSTLRRWSDEFVEFLSSEASSLSGKTHRRYTAQDVDHLVAVKGFMNNGLTYEQARQQLREQLEIPSTKALIANEDAAQAIVGYISETIENVRQGQMSVLNSQAANRELMGVVIQDNFNLKEENNRLRERMLDLERQMGGIRHEEMIRRETMRQEMDKRLSEIREMVVRNEQAAPLLLEDRPGCLGRLFGSPQTHTRSDTYPPQPPFPGAPPRSYPKPPGPPE